MALKGTPLGFSQSGSIDGQAAAGAVKRALGCAAGVSTSGVHGLPRQSVAASGAWSAATRARWISGGRAAVAFVDAMRVPSSEIQMPPFWL